RAKTRSSLGTAPLPFAVVVASQALPPVHSHGLLPLATSQSLPAPPFSCLLPTSPAVRPLAPRSPPFRPVGHNLQFSAASDAALRLARRFACLAIGVEPRVQPGLPVGHSHLVPLNVLAISMARPYPPTGAPSRV